MYYNLYDFSVIYIFIQDNFKNLYEGFCVTALASLQFVSLPFDLLLLQQTSPMDIIPLNELYVFDRVIKKKTHPIVFLTHPIPEEKTSIITPGIYASEEMKKKLQNIP